MVIGLTWDELGYNDSERLKRAESNVSQRVFGGLPKVSTEHTWNVLSLVRLGVIPAQDEAWGTRDQTAYKPGSVPPACADAAAIPLDRPSRNGSRDQPGSLGPATALPHCWGAGSLFGLAPGGACHAVPVASDAVRSYRTLSPLPDTRSGGLLSVALSLGSPPAGVTRRHVVVEPGLSSSLRPRPPGRLIRLQSGGEGLPGQPPRSSPPAGAWSGRSQLVWEASLSSAMSRARVSPSATPSTRSGRQ